MSFVHIPETLHELHSYTPLCTRLLVNRGITTEEEACRFLHPSYEDDLHDPFLFPDMDKALLRIFEAIEKKEQILIYADYDCDGIPGAVVLNDLFTKIGSTTHRVYIPDRHDEGYGLNEDAIRQALDAGVSLIITIDLGISDIEHIRFAEANGINVIVTDHHLPHEELPPAYAIINPKVGEYPEKMLCGAGVAFKLVQGFIKKYGTYFSIHEGWEKWSLDMAGLATLSDMVPLTGENRVLAYFGMAVLRKSRRPGFVQLLKKLKIDPRYLTEDDITFMITPRINAASRMDAPIRAFEMLSNNNVTEAGALAEHLSAINEERKYIVAHIMKEVHATLSQRSIGDVIVIGNPSWRIGVLGLVAGKIVEAYDRPVFVWGREGSQDEHIVKGSCRSNGAVNVVSLMHSMKESFVDYGGHEQAGGFSIATNEVHFLEEKIKEAYETGAVTLEKAHTPIDTRATLSDVSESTYATIASLAPFGLGNPKPLFSFEQVTVRSARLFGKEKNHLELLLEDKTAKGVKAIAFFSTEDSFSKKIQEGEVYTIIAHIEKSYFLNRPELRLRIVEVE